MTGRKKSEWLNRAEVVRAYRETGTLRATAQRLGCNFTRVWQILRKLREPIHLSGVPMRYRRGQQTPYNSQRLSVSASRPNRGPSRGVLSLDLPAGQSAPPALSEG